MNTLQPVTFFAATDLVVVGQNPENADYANPRGDIIRSAGFVYAEDEKGYRVRLHVKTGWEEEAMEAAQKLAEVLAARLSAGKLPVRFWAWESARPGYGSDAYVESGQGELEAWMDRFED